MCVSLCLFVYILMVLRLVVQTPPYDSHTSELHRQTGGIMQQTDNSPPYRLEEMAADC